MRIVITGVGTVWPLDSIDAFWREVSAVRPVDFGRFRVPVAPLCPGDDREVSLVLQKLPKIDRSVAMAILAARRAVASAGLTSEAAQQGLGINVGSSRGATAVFEQYHADFLAGQRLSPYSSPATTLGNLSTWIAYDLQSEAPAFCHAITCTTAGYALANGVAWLKAGMAERFLVGGAEAPLTAFTVAQLLALKAHATLSRPCLPFDPQSGGLALSEGAAMFVLEPVMNGIFPSTTLAEIVGIGWGNERFPNPAALTDHAEPLQQAMRLATSTLTQPVDYILAHAPGTVQGDNAELTAIKAVFRELPPFFSTKGIIGHSLGASFGFSLAFGLSVLGKPLRDVPICKGGQNAVKFRAKSVETVMINALGFGGTAVSMVIKHVT